MGEAMGKSLKEGEKISLGTRPKKKKTSLLCSHRKSCSVKRKTKSITTELGALAKEISRQTLKVLPSLFLLLTGKCNRRERLEKTQLNKNKSELAGFEHSYPF
jgi:hypothetical protein